MVLPYINMKVIVFKGKNIPWLLGFLFLFGQCRKSCFTTFVPCPRWFFLAWLCVCVCVRMVWQSTPVFLPGEFHGQRSLAGYSQWVHRVRHDWTTYTLSSLKTKWEVKFCFTQLIFFKHLFCWSIIALQYCVNFCHTAKWFNYTYIYTFFSYLSMMVYQGYWI